MRIAITCTSNPVCQRVRWRALYLLLGLLVQLASASPIPSSESPISDNEFQTSLPQRNTAEHGWRLPQELLDLHPTQTSHSSVASIENAFRDSVAAPKGRSSPTKESLALNSRDLPLGKNSHNAYQRKRHSPQVVKSNIHVAPLNITLAKNITFSYMLFIPEQFAFLQTVKLPGLYGGREAFANTHSKAEGNFQTYVMIREGGTVEFHIHSPLSTRPKRPTCTKPRGTNCNEDDVKFFVGGSSGRVGRGAWTAIRQDVWFASTQNAIGGYNLWINDTFVSGQSNIENLHLLPMENDEFSQTKHVFDDSGTGSSMYQMVGYPASKADGGKLVPYPSDERELDFGGPTKETQADGLSRGTLMTNENSGQPQLAVSGNSSPVGQEPKAPNYSQKVVQQNVTGVNMNNSRNLTTGNVNETKNATNTTSDYRYFGAFPALGIPELAELVKKNSHKVVPALTPQSIDSDKDEDEDEDEDGDEDEEADNNPSGEDLGPSSPSIQGANPNPLLGALGSLFLQHDESLQSNQLRHQPLRFFGFFTAPLSSHMTLPIRESNLEEPGLLLPSVKTFSISLKPVDYAS